MNTPIYSGIITNYVCTAACRHCMFASSYTLPKEYISREMAEKLARLLRKSGTYSVHIGGGDPSQTTLTGWEVFCFAMLDFCKRGRLENT